MLNFKSFINLVHSIEDKKMLEDFLTGITTEKEREELARRLTIVNKLIEGKTHKEIAKELGVGVATVTRGSKELSKGRFKILLK